MISDYGKAVRDRILAEGYEATIARLRRRLDELPAKIRRKNPSLRAIGVGGLEEAMTFWIKTLTDLYGDMGPAPRRRRPAPPSSPVIDLASARGRRRGRHRWKSTASAAPGSVAPRSGTGATSHTS